MESSPDSAAGVREGDILAGKYRVERVLGTGGMGVVVAAHHLHLDSKVALKFLLPDALGNSEAMARFVQEAQVAVKITSEHVARVIDVGQLENGAPYMVMEYLDGEDLAAWLKQRGPLPVEQAVEFVLQACEAIAEAHALGIVHRDLKPDNLFCVRRTDGRLSIKVLDFGISKMGQYGGLKTGSMTHGSTIMGSPFYMSPEHLKSARTVNSQTDIWALGVILFELVTGKPPFVAENLPELTLVITTELPPPIRDIRPEIPPGFEAVVQRCLEKDRERRYPNVAELALALLPFAPRRAEGSVERTSGIIQAAGLSVSALDVRPSPPVEGAKATLLSAGTMPAVGRTTGGSSGRKAALVVGGGVSAAIVLITLVGLATWKGGSRQHDAAAGAQATGPTPTQEAPAVDPPTPVEARATETVASDAPPRVPRIPQASAPARPAPVAVAPPRVAHCDPPYYFDANGNRIFKRECL